MSQGKKSIFSKFFSISKQIQNKLRLCLLLVDCFYLTFVLHRVVPGYTQGKGESYFLFLTHSLAHTLHNTNQHYSWQQQKRSSLITPLLLYFTLFIPYTIPHDLWTFYLLICLDFHNKIPWPGWLSWNFSSHSSRGWKVKDQGAGGFCFLWELSTWLAAFWLCPHFLFL